VTFQSDVWPELSWKKSILDLPQLTVTQKKPDEPNRVSAVLKKLQEANLEQVVQHEDYAAAMGDVVIARSLVGFSVGEDGLKGEPLDFASGDNVSIILSENEENDEKEGGVIRGLVQGLVAAKAGDLKVVYASQGLEAILFEVKVDRIATRVLPPLDDAFAASLRPGLTFEALCEEVRISVGEEARKRNVISRNGALEAALIELASCEITETIIADRAAEKFASLVAQQREGGMPREDLRALTTKECFEKYKKVGWYTFSHVCISRTLTSPLLRATGCT
jgi:FKBP-type peptidyl-prolyl cis-trans isomerase (trigger factor)